MPTFITTLYAFVASNLPLFVQIAVLLAAIGAFFGWLAGRYPGTKAANVFAVIAAYTIDVMKIVDEGIAFFGGQPPMLGRKRTTLMRGPFDNTSGVPQVNLRGFVPWIGVALASFLVLAMVMGACANLPSTITATANEAACVTADIDKTPAATFEQLVTDCGLDTLALAEQIVADVLEAEKKPIADGAVGLALPSEFHQHALAVHHADGGTK